MNLDSHEVELVVESEIDSGRWDAAAELAGGSPFHCHAWGAYRAALSGGRPLYVSWARGDRAASTLAVGLLRRPAPGIQVVEFDAMPACGSQAGPQAIAPLIEWSRRHGVVEVRLGSFGWASASATWASDPGRIEFLVKPGEPDELRRRMRKGARGSISRAQRLGLEGSLADASAVDEFVDLHAMTLERLRSTKEVGTAINRPALSHALGTLIGAGRARLYMARGDDPAVCGALFVCFCRTAYYLLNGASEAARSSGAMAYLLHFALADLSAAGFTSLNLGGTGGSSVRPSSPDHGLYEFKAGLGGQPVPCPPEQRLILRPALDAAFRTVRRLVRR